MAGFNVDIASLRQVGSHTIATGAILSSKVRSAQKLHSSALSMTTLQSGSLLTTTAQRWDTHIDRLAALVRSDGSRMLQVAEEYDADDNQIKSGFQQMIDDLGYSGEMNWSKVLVK